MVDVELLRPRVWVEVHGLFAGQTIKLHVPELGISSTAGIHAVAPCPTIAPGAGAVVTGRFVTRHAAALVAVAFTGGVELIGTHRHPVWSADRGDWVPLGELEPGETVFAHHGVVQVLATTPLPHGAPVYNLETHREHVYAVTTAGILVHNATPEDCARYQELLARGIDALNDLQKAEFERILATVAPDARTWQQYQSAVNSLYGGTSTNSLKYTVLIDGKLVSGMADNVADVAGRLLAVESKWVKASWATSIRNPASRIGDLPFAVAEQVAILNQARKYSKFFPEVIYHSNSPELIAHYTRVFQDAGITNFRFLLTR